MTDLEQKAEEYAIENLPDGYTQVNYDKKQAFKDGYEQGQESMMFEFAIKDRQELIKENEELKAKLADKDSLLEEYADKYEELKKENDILIKGLGCETCSIHLEYENLNNQIEKLKAQNEKMKCCSNCANGLRNGLLCDRQLECRKNNNKLWELAE